MPVGVGVYQRSDYLGASTWLRAGLGLLFGLIPVFIVTRLSL